MFPAFEHVPAYPLVFPLFWGAFAVFLLLVARHLRVFAATHADGPRATDRVLARASGVARYTIVQARMFRDPRAGVMHYALFLGSILLLLGNSNFVTGGLVEAIVGWPLDGALWTAFVAMLDLVAVGALVAVAWAFERRLLSCPPRLLLTRTALVILAMIALVVGTELLAQAFEAATYGDVAGAFVANAIAVPLRSLDPGATEAAFVALWWAHVVVLSAFLVYIPFNKHFHIYTSFVNVYFRKLAPRGQLPAMDIEQEDATFGIRTLEDLGWKGLLDGFTCTECGRCTEACPAAATGKSLDPRGLVMGIRAMAQGAEAGIDLVPDSPGVRERLGRDDRRPDPARIAAPLVGNAIPYDAVWDCLTCGACVEACPVLIEHVDTIVGLRRNLVLEESRFPSQLTAAFRGMETAGDPWGMPRAGRTDWTKGLPFGVPTIAELAASGDLESLEVLYWVGCAAAFDERTKKVARAVATCLAAAGVRFGILGEEESCTGDPARRSGNEYVYQVLATANIETLSRYGLDRRTIVTACPHCLNALGVEYAQLGARYEVVHHSVYLRRLLAAGRLPIASDPGRAGGTARRPSDTARLAVTLHDSCYMARYNGVFAEPREVLRALPTLELREMDKRERSTFCCGAGGGRMWMEETTGTRINEERARQAVATGAEAVVTECPFCLTMVRDGLAAVGADATGMRTADLAEILAESLAPSAATTR